jgi:hypothetical protein
MQRHPILKEAFPYRAGASLAGVPLGLTLALVSILLDARFGTAANLAWLSELEFTCRTSTAALTPHTTHYVGHDTGHADVWALL